MIPVPDRVGLEEQCRYAGVLAGLLARTVGVEIGDIGMQRRQQQDRAGIASDRDARDPARRRQEEPRLAARRGEVPQRRWWLLVRLLVPFGCRRGVRVGAS